MKSMLSQTAAPLKNAVLALGVLAVCSFFLPGLPTWITDNGNKYIVMRNYAQHGTAAIQHPEPELFPDGGFHFVRHRGRIRSFLSEYYPILASYPWRWFGERAAVWLSMLGTAAAVWLACMLSPHLRGTAWMLALATPMFFFSLLLWEMTWSVCAVLSALLLLQKKHPLAAGIVLGASLMLREEAYCVFIALTAVLMLRRDRATAWRLAAGFLLAALPLWGWQCAEFGHILGLHGGNYHLNNRPRTGFSIAGELLGALWNYYHHLFRFDACGDKRLDLLCQSPVFAACLLGAFASHKLETLKKIVGIAALIGWSALTAAFLLAPRGNSAFSAALVTGAVGSNPVLLPFMLNWRRLLKDRSVPVRVAAGCATLYLLIVPPLLTRADIGLIYGARHFLCVMPLLLFLSAHAIRLKLAPGKNIWYLLAAVSVMLQIGSFRMLKCVADESETFESALAAAPEKTIVTDAFFLPEQTPHLFFAKTIYKLDETNVEKLAVKLRDRGESDFLLVLSNRYRAISDARLAVLLNVAPPVAAPERFHPAKGSGFMDLYIVRCRLK